MKYTVNITINQNGERGLVGHELDEQVEDAIRDIEIDGWEVSKVSLSRSENARKSSQENEHDIQRLKELCAKGCSLVDAGQGNARSEVNPDYTVAEMLALPGGEDAWVLVFRERWRRAFERVAVRL